MAYISIIQYPVGTYGFVGTVPVDLGYRITGASCFDRKKVREAISHCGPGIAKKLASKLGVNMEAKAFETRSEAYDVAAAFIAAHNLDLNIFS